MTNKEIDELTDDAFIKLRGACISDVMDAVALPMLFILAEIAKRMPANKKD